MGKRGPIGPTGPTGANGMIGPTGPPGPPSSAAIFSIVLGGSGVTIPAGTVEVTLLPWQTLSILYMGITTTYGYVNNFSLPLGIFIPPTNGYYNLSATVTFIMSGTGTSQVTLYLIDIGTVPGARNELATSMFINSTPDNTIVLNLTTIPFLTTAANIILAVDNDILGDTGGQNILIEPNIGTIFNGFLVSKNTI